MKQVGSLDDWKVEMPNIVFAADVEAQKPLPLNRNKEGWCIKKKKKKVTTQGCWSHAFLFIYHDRHISHLTWPLIQVLAWHHWSCARLNAFISIPTMIKLICPNHMPLFHFTVQQAYMKWWCRLNLLIASLVLRYFLGIASLQCSEEIRHFHICTERTKQSLSVHWMYVTDYTVCGF